MSVLLKKVESESLALPINERAKLAYNLIVSLDEHVDSDVDNLWENEISKRVKNIKNGTAKGRHITQVLSEIEAKYK